jgi:hypothetical protein
MGLSKIHRTGEFDDGFPDIFWCLGSAYNILTLKTPLTLPKVTYWLGQPVP